MTSSTLLHGQEILPRKEIFDHPGDEVDEGFKKELVLVDRFAGVAQQNLRIEVALNMRRKVPVLFIGPEAGLFPSEVT